MTTTRTHSRSRRLGLALALTAALGCSLVLGSAHAAVYTPSSGDELQNALADAAKSLDTADEIHLGPGVYSRANGFEYDGGSNEQNWIAIEGVPGQTTLQTADAWAPTAQRVLELHGSGADTSHVLGVTLRAPGTNDTLAHNGGLVLERASAINVVVEPRVENGLVYSGVMLLGDARLRSSKVRMPGDTVHGYGVVSEGTDTRVEQVQTSGGHAGIQFEPNGQGTVSRAYVDARKAVAGIACSGCKGLDIDDSVVRVGGEAVGLIAHGSTAHWVIANASHVTVLGEGAGSGVGAAAVGPAGTKGTVLRLDNCVLWNLAATLYRYGETGTTADMVTRNCNYPAQQELDKGPGKIDPLGHTELEPGFIYPDGGDVRLRWNSELIDIGRTFVLFAESPFTLDHANRIVDGNSDGQAVPDLGAYEYQAHPPKIAIQPLPSLYANEPFTVDASKSWGVDPGEPVTFKWTLPGGRTADTPTVGMKLAAGKHELALTVTDPTGKTATEHRTLTVVERPGREAGTSSALLSRVRVAPARVKRGSAQKLTFSLSSRATVRAKVQRRAGRRWRKVRAMKRTLGAGKRGMKLPRATRAGRWRVVVTARAGSARGSARAAYRVR